jgi:hypothetical protein
MDGCLNPRHILYSTSHSTSEIKSKDREKERMRIAW